MVECNSILGASLAMLRNKRTDASVNKVIFAVLGQVISEQSCESSSSLSNSEEVPSSSDDFSEMTFGQS